MTMGENFSISLLNKVFTYMQTFHPYVLNTIGVAISLNEISQELELNVVTEPFAYTLSQMIDQYSEDFSDSHRMWASLDLILSLDAFHVTGVPLLVLNPDMIFFTSKSTAKIMFPAILKTRTNPDKFLSNYLKKGITERNDLFIHPQFVSKELKLPKKRINMLVDGYQNEYRDQVVIDIYSLIMCLSFMFNKEE